MASLIFNDIACFCYVKVDELSHVILLTVLIITCYY